MDKKPSGFKARWKARYHHASIQLILSIAFTAVAVIGMLFLGMALLLRFSSSANEMAAESSQRVLAQVNWNLDSYLRNMMRVSDTVYYRVIKSADLEQSDTAQELRDALKLLYAKDRDVLVSLAVFDENPLNDIHALESCFMTVKNGEILHERNLRGGVLHDKWDIAVRARFEQVAVTAECGVGVNLNPHCAVA